MFKRWRKFRKDSSEKAALEQERDDIEKTVPLQMFQMAEYELIASLMTDRGSIREVNEDSCCYIQPQDAEVLKNKGALFVIADGMGGHSAGDVASKIAVDILSRVYYDTPGNSQSVLLKAFREANREIYEAALKNEKLEGMGTTCTSLVLQNGSAILAHVGDSRVYLVRDNQIYLMTQDHSEVMEMVKRGLLNLQEARHHPDKNVILQALGTRAQIEISAWREPFPVRAGDRFVLCSDGLYDLVEDEEIKQAVLTSDPHSACEGLIALAKERGGHDNITVGVVGLMPESEGSDRKIPQTRETEAAK